MNPAQSDIRRTALVLGAPIDVLTWEEALSRLQRWVTARESRYVCICNVHSVVTASQDADFAQVVANADMATPDGAPVAWMLRRLGHPQQQRINGPDLMLRLCEQASAAKQSVCLFGSTSQTLALLQIELRRRWPQLRIADAISPPFRPPTPEESQGYVDRINNSSAGLVFVSLGCPKQEQWMAAHRGRVHSVMIGVGAAFDFHARTVTRAPQWMRDNGLEWAHRLLSEPKRLWRRYLTTNSRFLYLAALQLLHHAK